MKKGELWIAGFPFRKGREQSGKRPVIVIADTKTSVAIVIPLTSNLEAIQRFSYVLEIKKSEENKLEKDSAALIFQLQALDKRRFVAKLGVIEQSYIEEIDRTIKDLLKIS